MERSIFADKKQYPSKTALIKTLKREVVRGNVMDWSLNYATRLGFEPDSIIGRMVNRVVQIKERIGGYLKNRESVRIPEELRKYPLLVEYEALVKQRRPMTGLRAERLDRVLQVKRGEILKDKGLVEVMGDKAPEFYKSLKRELTRQQNQHSLE